MEILIIEDDAITRYKLNAILDGHNGFRVAAAVESAEEAISYLLNMRVDLAILDLGLPGLSDAAAVTALRIVSPDLKIMVFTASGDDHKVFPALKAGAIGYLLKETTPEQILSAVEDIKAGGSPMSPSIARKVLEGFQRQDPERQPVPVPGNGGKSPLSHRETEILKLLYRGDELSQIADTLCISLHTVRVHTKKIYFKLNVNSRSHAIYQALKQNLIEA